MIKTDFTRRDWLKAAAATGMATGVSLRTPFSVSAAESPAEPARKATDYQRLAEVDFLPGLDKLDLGEKAKVIQSLLEENFFHPSGLFYSILLIDGPRTLRPMSRADLIGVSDTVVEGHYADGGQSSEAAKDEGMTFENSIYSAGLYLQAQAARYAATHDPAALEQGRKAFNALRLIYDHGKQHGRSGWLGKPYGRVPKDHSTPDQYHAAILGLYRFQEVAARPDQEQIRQMLRGIADFMTRRNYQIWDLNKPEDALPWNPQEAYCNATYVLAQAIAFRLSGDAKYRQEALRLAGLSRWREESNLDLWRRQGLDRMLQFERICLGAFVLQATEVIQEVLPELFGATSEAQASCAAGRRLGFRGSLTRNRSRLFAAATGSTSCSSMRRGDSSCSATSQSKTPREEARRFGLSSSIVQGRRMSCFGTPPGRRILQSPLILARFTCFASWAVNCRSRKPTAA